MNTKEPRNLYFNLTSLSFTNLNYLLSVPQLENILKATPRTPYQLRTLKSVE